MFKSILKRLFRRSVEPKRDYSTLGPYRGWRWVPPYGQKVEIVHRYLEKDPPLGTIGHVLTEAEHGITRHPGYVTMTTDFPGIRGFHYLVRLEGEGKPRKMTRDMFAPAYG